MKYKNVKIKTLGCKVNRCESDTILEKLLENGYKIPKKDEKADLCIVNTCAVTGRACMFSRQAVRKFIKENQGAKVLVTGCYINLDSKLFQDIKGVDKVFKNEEKNDIINYLTNKSSDSDIAISNSRTRAFIKIQDGCKSFCSYCIIPFTRDKLKSVPPQEVHKTIEDLHGKGFKEIVLTGINLGAYGKDRKEDCSLFTLLKDIQKNKKIERVRISSIEPKRLTDEIIEFFATSDILCPHFHIPLQSGDDNILKAMNRPYNTLFFKNLILKIKEKMPQASIGSDVICGFPGEDEISFLKTLSFIKSLPLSYLHVFPYSDREGTKAYSMQNKVAPEIKKERAKKLRELGLKKKEEFIKNFIGKEEEILIEQKRGDFYKGFTKNYITVFVESDVDIRNQIVKQKIVNV